MNRHATHLWYVLRRKAAFVRYGRMLGVSWWDCLTHDLLMFSPRLWRLAVRVYHQPEGEEWVKARVAELGPTAFDSHVFATNMTPEEYVLEIAKRDHVKWTKAQAKLSDRYMLEYQHRAPWRWEGRIVRDMAETRYVEMEPRWVRVMVSDWLTGAIMDGVKREELAKVVKRWYAQHRQEIRLYPSARKLVEQLLGELQ